MLWDSHVHSSLSFDGSYSIDEFMKSKGSLDGIVFTEHYDILDGIDPKDDNAKPFDVNEYLNTMTSAKEKYGDTLRCGVEIGLRPDTPKKVIEASEFFDYDFIIGSSHIVWGVNVSHDNSFCKPLTKSEAYSKYLEEVYENIKLYSKHFDVYGHLDYIARYGGYSDKVMHYDEFSDLIDKLLNLLIENGCGIEVNTAGYRQGFESPHPDFSILKRYFELGGEIVTIGSDAHTPDALGFGFDRALVALKEAGCTKICTFKNRKPEFIKI